MTTFAPETAALHDVVVVGGGLVGASLAIALDRAGMTIETALARCMTLYEPVPVRDGEGNMVGFVRPGELAAALQAETDQ